LPRAGDPCGCSGVGAALCGGTDVGCVAIENLYWCWNCDEGWEMVEGCVGGIGSISMTSPCDPEAVLGKVG
jgi:hypothetical protein